MMRMLPYERPTEHYDERIIELDEQICSLIQQRKEASDNNPGFPPLERIAEWSSRFGLYEEFLRSMFAAMLNEENFRPIVKPADFRKHIPLLKSVEQKERFYTLTSIHQYSNASVIILNIDWEAPEQPFERPEIRQHYSYELFIGEEYDCRMMTGGSRSDHASYRFLVSPPLPDDPSGTEFRFQESSGRFDKMELGEEIVFKM